MIAQQRGDSERREAGHKRIALPEYVSPANDGGNGRREGGRPADTESFEFLDERRFGVSRRRCGLVLLRLRIEQHDRRSVTIDLVADAARRQDGLLLFELRNRIVAAFYVRAAEARELNRLTTRGQHRCVAA